MKNKMSILSSFTEGIIILSFSPPEEVPTHGEYYGCPTHITVIDISSSKEYYQLSQHLEDYLLETDERINVIEQKSDHKVMTHADLAKFILYGEGSQSSGPIDLSALDANQHRGLLYSIRKYVRRVTTFVMNAVDEIEYNYLLKLSDDFVVINTDENLKMPTMFCLERIDIYQDNLRKQKEQLNAVVNK